ncbi:MAG: hypothetical protein ACOC1K_04825, partial [Nanoarchaeota archaeon]
MLDLDKKILITLTKGIGDIITVNFSFFMGFIIIMGFYPFEYFSVYKELIIFISILSVLLMNIFEIYSFSEDEDVRYKDIKISVFWVSLIIIIFIVFFNLIPVFNYNWFFLITSFILMILFLLSWHYIIFKFEKKIMKPKKTVIVGEINQVKEFIKKINSRKNKFNLIAVIVDEYDISLEEKLDGDNIITYYGLRWVETTLDKLEPELVFLALDNLADKVKNRLYNIDLEADPEIYLAS